MVNMAITIQNLKFVRNSVDCILNRYISIDDLLSNFVRGLFVSSSVVSDFQLDYFWWKYSLKYGVGAHNNNDWKLQNASANRFIPTQQDRFVPFDN